jgi:hypothetical protein
VFCQPTLAPVARIATKRPEYRVRIDIVRGADEAGFRCFLKTGSIELANRHEYEEHAEPSSSPGCCHGAWTVDR